MMLVLILFFFIVTMKKLIFFFFLFLYACTSMDDVVESKFFELSEKTLRFYSLADTQSVCVRTNVDWNILTELPRWISMSNNIDSMVSFRVDANEGEERKCEVIFHSGLGEETLDIKQDAKAELQFEVEEFYVDFGSRRFDIKIDQNIPYKLKIDNEGSLWLSRYSKWGNISTGEIGSMTFDSNVLTLEVDENDTSRERKAKVIVYNDIYHLSDTLFIVQKGSGLERYVDGDYIVMQKSERGSVSLIVTGDGFMRKDLLHGGKYQKCMDSSVDYFFSIEPYKSYRDYFNIYMVVAESEEEGVGEKNLFGGSSAKNKFGTAYGSGTEIVCNDELIFEYARKIKELPEDKPITVLVVLNSDKYAGTAYLYPDGNSIALCPMSTAEPPNDFEGIVHHEAGGHAFGFLVDEYVYNQAEMPESRKKEIQEWQKQGYQMNLDFTDDLDKILWKDFIGIDKYAPVGAYEGGYEYQYGVWRSEENSCMNNNIPYYNVQSRWSIVKRIMDLSEIEFSVQDFIKNDYPEYPKDSRALNAWENFVPLGTPVWVTK